MWQQWVTAILGLWVIAIPFMGITANALIWTLTISGLAIAILGIWGAQQEQTLEDELRDLRLQTQ